MQNEVAYAMLFMLGNVL